MSSGCVSTTQPLLSTAAVTSAVDKSPAYARLSAVASAGDLPTAATPRPGARPLSPGRRLGGCCRHLDRSQSSHSALGGVEIPLPYTPDHRVQRHPVGFGVQCSATIRMVFVLPQPGVLPGERLGVGNHRPDASASPARQEFAHFVKASVDGQERKARELAPRGSKARARGAQPSAAGSSRRISRSYSRLFDPGMRRSGLSLTVSGDLVEA